MAPKLIFVGGVSAAGKTTVAKALRGALGLPLLSLDVLFHHVAVAGHAGDAAACRMSTMSRALVSAMLDAGAHGIVEGTWLSVEDVAGMHGRPGFVPVFCGFPNADPRARLEEIQRKTAGAGVYWLAGKQPEFALAWIEEQIAESAVVRDACAAASIPFFDFTCFQLGGEQVLGYCRDRTARAPEAQSAT